MALLRCEDCGGPVSDQATACPKCGRPTGLLDLSDPRVCPNCEQLGIIKSSGVHGVAEITTTIAMTFLFLVPGLLIYFYLSAKPWCEVCHERPPEAEVSNASLWTLTACVIFLAWLYFVA